MNKETELFEQILKALHRMKSTKLDEIFKGLNQYEFVLMQIIEKKTLENGKGIFVSELADNMKVSSPAISRKLGMLEEKGLLIRVTDEEDRRNTYVCLTKKGVQTKKEASEKMKYVIIHVIQNMGNEKIEQMILLWNEFSKEMQIEAEKLKQGEKYV